jgi:hypothetical protein
MCVTPANIVEENLQHLVGCIGLLTPAHDWLKKKFISTKVYFHRGKKLFPHEKFQIQWKLAQIARTMMRNLISASRVGANN